MNELAVELPLNELVEPTPLAQDDWTICRWMPTGTWARHSRSMRRCDLRELSEVFELTVDKDALSSFGDMPMPEASADDVLQEEFVDAFAAQEPTRGKPLESTSSTWRATASTWPS